MNRPRACAALIHYDAVQGDTILMMRHVAPKRSYWTLPGGGIEANETPAQAAVREMWEETGVRVRVVRLLWEGVYGHGATTSTEYCFLVEPEAAGDGRPAFALGCDPEEADLPAAFKLLQGAEWVPVQELTSDVQVARVLMALAERGKAIP